MAQTKILKKKRSGIRPKKKLGQHFIKHRSVIDQILESAQFQPFDRILEIGAGLGALTIPLARCVDHVIAVEKDPYLSSILEEKLSKASLQNVHVINADILKVDFNQIPGIIKGPIHVIGNLPYNISSPFLEQLIGARDLVHKAVLMFQTEFAQRLIASPCTKAYGAMTVWVQYHASITPLLDVPKDVFYPKPKVDSKVLALDMDTPHPRRADDDVFFKKVVRGAFSQRRKTILNSLKGSFPEYTMAEITIALEQCFIDPGQRAETLDMDTFLCLATVLRKD